MAEVEDVEDKWSDAHDTMDDEQSVREHPRGIDSQEIHANEDLAVTGVKIATEEKVDPSPIHDSDRGGSLSTTGERTSDAASVHSLPVVHVTEPQSPSDRPTTARTLEYSTISTTRIPSPSPTQTHVATTDNSLTPQVRRSRHRSAIEVRSSNRLSGFFTNLIHRRDPMSNGTSRNTIREDRANTPPAGSTSNPPSRSSSPIPTRPVTPPPQLPPPTLRELGLSLSVVTSNLSPSHFSTPPSSGAFLAPHYLLLCHAQGLDVLPLVSPPAPQPYALVRRVSFKSVVVMEQRGVLVAIAGRRDGVRVYALEEVKNAVEWRIEVEVRRERDRMRREAAKKAPQSSLDSNSSEHRNSLEKKALTRLSTPPPSSQGRAKLARKTSYGGVSATSSPATRTPVVKKPKTPPPLHVPTTSHEPSGRPPPYSSAVDIQPRLQTQPSIVSLAQPQSRRTSASNAFTGSPVARRHAEGDALEDCDSKADWVAARESSDDEAINIVAAASSGSQALDERTSAQATVNPTPPSVPTQPTVPLARTSTAISTRRRPANLDLTLSRTSSSPMIPSEPSPTPTLLTLRQALSNSPPTQDPATVDHIPDTPLADGEEDDDDQDGGITLAQALLESRLPELPPPGTRNPQQPIILSASHPVVTGDEDVPSSPRTSEVHSTQSRYSTPGRSDRRRRRWSVLDGMFSNGPSNIQSSINPTPSMPTGPNSTSSRPSVLAAPAMRERTGSRGRHAASLARPPPSGDPLLAEYVPRPVPPLPQSTTTIAVSEASSRSRFIPRIFSNAFNSRRSDDNSQTFILTAEGDNTRRTPGTPAAPHAPAPKLEYVKLPGTKGALMVKAVETAKKSFLAILCGDNGEKVELFAGTYRTALGLSRTFILPDSPRTLELQLQGDDLVEVFLVFSQNVFGLEPATVRVREVRIGRAERRAARRRAREIRTGDATVNDNDAPSIGEDDPNVNVSIGVSVAVGSTVVASGDGPDGPQTPPLLSGQSPDGPPLGEPANGSTSALAHADEIVALATAQMGSYTSFQQLSFAPNFPLASIADEYIIPPTYPAFLEYRAEHEPEVNGNNILDLSQVQFSPPGLPVPGPSTPSKWFYRDPKGVIHGPWKSSLMQAWYKDGLLPPDLPVRREEETEYVLLKDLRLQTVDPTHPFRSPPPPPPPLNPQPLTNLHDATKPLLSPISLLSQPKHFGPPALFYSSRGGHSTAIVDARGRSVLKGRFLWSADEHDDSKPSLGGRMGDVKRLEAFDVRDRAVLVAMRQGGLEAMDLGDALLRPADESRTVLPQFSPPPSNTNRRGPFVWKIGTPVSASPTSSTVLSSKYKGIHIPGKKQSSGSAKSPGSRSEFSIGDAESDNHDEVLFLGRKDDEIYICERNAGSFRILRLCPCFQYA